MALVPTYARTAYTLVSLVVLLIFPFPWSKEDKVLTVWIETPEMTARELIVNPFENLQAKHDY